MNNQRPIIKAASACVWRGDEVLLVQRGKALGHGLWSLPGGKLEPGETALDAAARELREEAGIEADLQHHVGDFSVESGDIRFEISCFTGPFLSGEAKAGTDAKDVAWVHWQHLGRFHLAPNIADAVAIARNLISL